MAYGQTLQRNGPHEFSKATIGVTRERGTSLSNTAKCVPSKPGTARVIDAIKIFGGVACAISARHVDVPESSQVATISMPRHS